jgi:hypothetical protein
LLNEGKEASHAALAFPPWCVCYASPSFDLRSCGEVRRGSLSPLASDTRGGAPVSSHRGVSPPVRARYRDTRPYCTTCATNGTPKPLRFFSQRYDLRVSVRKKDARSTVVDSTIHVVVNLQKDLKVQKPQKDLNVLNVQKDLKHVTSACRPESQCKPVCA